MQNHKRLLLLFFLLSLNYLFSQELHSYSYQKLSSLFDPYPENDERALVFVHMYVSKANKERNIKRLIEGYEEAVYYSSSLTKKLNYSDSTINIAIRSKDNDKISRAFLGKGIVYYYNERNYKKALEEYLKAFKYGKESKDFYQRNKIIYHLGMVKYYLGYYEAAAEHFTEAAAYFENSIRTELHPTIKKNNESGYFNSIYRLSECYKNLHDYGREDSLIAIGLAGITTDRPYSIDYAYFQKSKGIQLLRLNKQNEALKYLKSSLKVLAHKQDFITLATVDFYLGKLYWEIGNRRDALRHFHKVDSIVQEIKFITPEIRSNYEFLIKDAKENNNETKQLYFTNQLLRADSLINKDFAFLSSRLHREYDTKTLIEEKNKLIEDNNKGRSFLFLTIFSSIALAILITYRFYKKDKFLTAQYEKLLENNKVNKDKLCFEVQKNENESTKNLYSDEIIADVKNKLQIFEEKKQFLQKNIKLPEVASSIGTNRTTLSYVLNDHLNMSFTQYIKILRIRYITNLMLENNKFLQYNIDSLALECGMSNRQVFSAHFLEINGMRPTDFIRKRLEELEKLK